MKTALLSVIPSLLLGIQVFSSSGTISTAPTSGIPNDQPTLNFPDSITFQANIESNATITSVTLEYGTNELTCGAVIAKAIPQFTPGKALAVEWTWEMRQSGSLPPGATIWWRWRYGDETGLETISKQKTVVWLDAKHDWQALSSGHLYLHWYSGDQSFAQALLDAAVSGLGRLDKEAGLRPDKPIHLYIYPGADDMREAILYEPTWTGGMAFPRHDIVIIGISPSETEWGRATIVHELTHVLVGHLTFSCLGSVPTWLNEGLAVYSEGELDPDSEAQLNDAIRNDQLLSVRSLSTGFSEIPSKAYLSYSQSYSLVKYLIETHGREKMNSLLVALRNGSTIDDALLQIYGFSIEGLEVAWRQAIGARARPASPNPTAQPTPTYIPTIAPFSGAPLASAPTPYAIPTSSVKEPISQRGRPPIALTLLLASVCCILAILSGLIGLGIYLGARRGGKHETQA